MGRSKNWGKKANSSLVSGLASMKLEDEDHKKTEPQPAFPDWVSLPPDLWAEIFKRTGLVDKLRSSEVCRDFRRLLSTYKGIGGTLHVTLHSSDRYAINDYDTRVSSAEGDFVNVWACDNLGEALCGPIGPALLSRIRNGIFSAIEIVSVDDFRETEVVYNDYDLYGGYDHEEELDTPDDVIHNVERNLSSLLTACSQATPRPSSIAVSVNGRNTLDGTGFAGDLITLAHSLTPSAHLELNAVAFEPTLGILDAEDGSESDEERGAVEVSEFVNVLRSLPDAVTINLETITLTYELIRILHRVHKLDSVDEEVGPLHVANCKKGSESSLRTLNLELDVESPFPYEDGTVEGAGLFDFLAGNGYLSQLSTFNLTSVACSIPSDFVLNTCASKVRHWASTLPELQTVTFVASYLAPWMTFRRPQPGAPLRLVIDSSPGGLGPLQPSEALQKALNSMPPSVEEVRVKDSDHWLPSAVRCENMKLVKSLLSRGANPNCGNLLEEMVEKEDVPMARALLEAGATVKPRTLRLAVTGKSAPMLDLLLSRPDIDIDIKNEKGQTLLQVLLSATWTTSSAERVRVLCKHGAKVDVMDRAGDTPLLTAARQGAQRIVTVLISHGANVHHKNNAGKTAEDLVRAELEKVEAKKAKNDKMIEAANEQLAKAQKARQEGGSKRKTYAKGLDESQRKVINETNRNHKNLTELMAFLKPHTPPAQ